VATAHRGTRLRVARPAAGRLVGRGAGLRHRRLPRRQRAAHRVGRRGRLLRHPDPGVGARARLAPRPGGAPRLAAAGAGPAGGARVGRAGPHRVRGRHLRRVDGLPGDRRAGSHAGIRPRPRRGRRRHPVVSGGAPRCAPLAAAR
jgi:hypothetical protein